MNKKLIILISLILLLSTGSALIKPTNSIEQEPLEKDTEETFKEILGDFPYYLCTQEFNPGGGGYTYYNGDLLTENASTCNARVVGKYDAAGDKNLGMIPTRFFGESQFYFNPYYPNLTFPPAYNTGIRVESDFNWNKPTDYCFTEKYTSRHKTGTINGEPTYQTGSNRNQDRSFIDVLSTSNGTNQATYEFHIPVENINRPITNITTNQTQYTLDENQTILPITITITDPDLGCGNAKWPVLSLTPIWFRFERSAETFEIRLNGQTIPSTDVNYSTNEIWNYTGPAGSFGIFLTETNTGQITILYDTNNLPPGDNNITLTVYDTDGYLTMNGSYLADTFILEEYGTPHTTNITITKPGPQYICGDANGDKTVNISDAVYLIAYIFSGGTPPEPLLSGDANNDKTVNISDAVYLISYIFSGGNPPNCGN